MRLTIESLRGGKPVQILPDLFIYKPPKALTYNDLQPLASLWDDDVFATSPSLAHAGFGYTILEEGFIARAVRAYDLFRLQYIHQLGFLEDPDAEEGELLFANKFQHTRYLHSLDVTALAAAIVHNNNDYFDAHPGHDKVVIAAALTHDVLTPAGGDTTKSIDFDAFDEDKWYPEVLKRPAVAQFLKEEAIDPNLLAATVRGKGVLGSILDLVDKLAYVSRDSINFEGSIGTRRMDWSGSPARAAITPYAVTQHLTGVWEHVRVDEEGVVVENADKLEVFVAARALLFRNLYTHPRARYHESLKARAVLSYLYDTGKITRDDLLRWVDDELRLRAGEFFTDAFPRQFGQHSARYRTFATLADARRFEQHWLGHGAIFVQTEDVGRFFKPGTHFRVDRPSGVQPFAEAFPERAEQIRTMGQPIDPIRVYYFAGKQPWLREGIYESMHAWRMEKFVDESARSQ